MEKVMQKKSTYTIIGCGKLGRSLALGLKRAGYEPVGFYSQSIDSAKITRELVKAGKVSSFPWELTVKSDLVFITTPDSVIEDVCKAITAHQGFHAKTILFHASGALSSTLLQSARSLGAAIGSLHPLQSFTKETAIQVNPFEGIIMAVEGDPAALTKGHQLAKALGATSIRIKTEQKMLYHAAAVVASNYLVTLMDFALNLLEMAGIQSAEGFDVLSPLISGTLSNIKTMGTEKALTGPISRGDDNILRQHMTHIQEQMPAYAEFYQILGYYTVEIAQKGGSLSTEQAAVLKKILQKS